MPLTFDDVCERSKGTLVDDEESFNKKIAAAKNERGDKRFRLVNHVKFEFKPKCRCPNTIHCTLRYLKNNIDSCNVCRKENNPQKSQGLATLDKEKMSIKTILDLMPDLDTIDCSSLVEGTDADIAIRPNNVENDEYLKIQCKCSTAKVPKFHMNKNLYPDSTIILHDMRDEPQYWVIPPNQIEPLTVIGISGSTGKYAKYSVKPEQLGEKIKEIYQTDVRKFTREECLTPKGKEGKLEHEHVKLRETVLPNLTYENPGTYSHTDYIINGLKVQDKVKNPRSDGNGNSFLFVLQKRVNGKLTNYDIGDNDLYWCYLNETNKFYVIPEDKLKKDNKIRDNITLYADHSKLTNRSRDLWTKDYQFDYRTINEPDEYARLMELF